MYSKAIEGFGDDSFLSKRMAARSRPRAGPLKDDSADAHEERNMWNQIVNDLKRLKTIQTRASEVSKSIVDMESKMAERKFL